MPGEGHRPIDSFAGGFEEEAVEPVTGCRDPQHQEWGREGSQRPLQQAHFFLFLLFFFAFLFYGVEKSRGIERRVAGDRREARRRRMGEE